MNFTGFFMLVLYHKVNLLVTCELKRKIKLEGNAIPRHSCKE